MNALKTIIRVVAVLALLPVLCVMVAVILLAIGRTTAQAEIDQQLTAIDQQFEDSRGVISASIVNETLLPEAVGDFRRSTEIIDQRCVANNDVPQPCFYASYDNEVMGKQFGISLQIWKIAEQSTATLDDIMMFMPRTCGDMVNTIGLRRDSKIPYMFGSCPLGIFAPPRLGEIMWQNGVHFIQVNGSYDAMSQFIAAYPY